MKKVLFVIANYNNEKQQIFDEKISPRNQEYADLHGFDYTGMSSEAILLGGSLP
mgnify:CR=1 FL=1